MFVLPFVVVEITNCKYSYAAVNTKFWLSDVGIEDPKSDIVLLEFPANALTINGDILIKFEYDMGRYDGLYQSHIYPIFQPWIAKKFRMNNGTYCSAIITNIGSL